MILLIDLSVMALIGLAQVMTWWFLNRFISTKIGRSTKDDYVACIKEKIFGPAVIRLGIHISTAWMVTAAFSRWIRPPV